MVKNKRIEFLAELTKGFHTVLDIGSDHGLVLLKAFENNYIQKAIASDIREKPLNQAKINLKNYPVEFIQSDGFLRIDKPFDCAVIAGMGSHLITNILKKSPEGQQIYILQPNDKPEKLRHFLSLHQFKIIDEFVIFDKHYYPIIVMTKGDQILSNEDLILGPILRKKPEAILYYKHRIKTLKPILTQADTLRKQTIDSLITLYEKGLQSLIE